MAHCADCEQVLDEEGRCPDCDDRAEADPVRVTQELVAVLRTSDSNLLPVVKSVLQAAGIPFVVQGDEAMGLLPLGPFGGGVFRDVLGASVLVPQDRADEALELLRSCDAPNESG
ncbi:MAG TPA: DUF2007 domain-containing protein [Candidatus Polarisedimenticolaceae bacterium]|nr:DUF2007 domain-containing protein [Candidatus Polarisedimenticolaceae bacterium]